MVLPWVEKKIFADALAWSASIAVHRAAVPCETPGAWQLPLLFGALPSWERALEKEWSNPSFDHLQLRKNKRKRKEVLLSLATVQPKIIRLRSSIGTGLGLGCGFDSAGQTEPKTEAASVCPNRTDMGGYRR
jgi:hypothetical protein